MITTRFHRVHPTRSTDEITSFMKQTEKNTQNKPQITKLFSRFIKQNGSLVRK